ncbi:hypothetical protein SLEP1_g24883 [Rubroshorea leprosula]|uniref:Uncharacterized protein n=1 Tax=Rubroshorea leprosula TaxID=152421 RepID=A0AAV5JHA0_9ROSI|nr:hypothetical protein SLEP1_g24883 [Rubroshorea leprosula]
MSFLRPKKGTASSKTPSKDSHTEDEDEKKGKSKGKQTEDYIPAINKKCSCLDCCFWFVGFVCCIWWFLLCLFTTMPASIPQFVTEAIAGPLPDPPSMKLSMEGLTAKHPVVFLPGIVTGGLELWEGCQCADGLFRKRLWGVSFGELYKL